MTVLLYVLAPVNAVFVLSDAGALLCYGLWVINPGIVTHIILLLLFLYVCTYNVYKAFPCASALTTSGHSCAHDVNIRLFFRRVYYVYNIYIYSMRMCVCV